MSEGEETRDGGLQLGGTSRCRQEVQKPHFLRGDLSTLHAPHGHLLAVLTRVEDIISEGVDLAGDASGSAELHKASKLLNRFLENHIHGSRPVKEEHDAVVLTLALDLVGTEDLLADAVSPQAARINAARIGSPRPLRFVRCLAAHELLNERGDRRLVLGEELLIELVTAVVVGNNLEIVDHIGERHHALRNIKDGHRNLTRTADAVGVGLVKVFLGKLIHHLFGDGLFGFGFGGFGLLRLLGLGVGGLGVIGLLFAILTRLAAVLFSVRLFGGIRIVGIRIRIRLFAAFGGLTCLIVLAFGFGLAALLLIGLHARLALVSLTLLTASGILILALFVLLLLLLLLLLGEIVEFLGKGDNFVPCLGLCNPLDEAHLFGSEGNFNRETNLVVNVHAVNQREIVEILVKSEQLRASNRQVAVGTGKVGAKTRIAILHHAFNSRIFNNVHILAHLSERARCQLFKIVAPLVTLGAVEGVTHFVGDKHIVQVAAHHLPHRQRQDATLGVKGSSLRLRIMLNANVLRCKQLGKQ